MNPFIVLGHFFEPRLSAAFNKVKNKGIAKKILSTILLLLQSIIGVRRLAAVICSWSGVVKLTKIRYLQVSKHML